jgi:DNA-binding transcriptional LysR family regulator
MGVKLFDRRQLTKGAARVRRGRVLPTPAGVRFLEAARGILLACNAVKADLRAISAPRAFRVGVLQSRSTRHVADLLGSESTA